MIRTLSESKDLCFLFLVLIKRMKGGEGSSRFPCVNPGIWELSLSFSVSEMVKFSACGVFVDD